MPNFGYQVLGMGAHEQGAAFSPTDISGLTLWLDASDISTLYQDAAKTTPVASDGDPVGAWVDKSSAGNDVTQSTAGYKPTYKTNIQNGLPSILGVLDYMLRTADAADFFNETESTAFIIVNQNSSNPLNVGFYGQGSAPNMRQAFLSPNSTPNRLEFWDAGSEIREYYTDITDWYDNFNLVSFYRSGSDMEAFINGASVASTAVASGSKTWTSVPMYVFTAPWLTAVQNGYICSLILYRSALSTADRQSVETYLANKWGITI